MKTRPSALLGFTVFAALLTIVPGADTALVIRSALRGGRASGVAAGAGVGLGILWWSAASAVGLTALVRASETGYTVLRIAGGAYLIYLGARTLWHSRSAVPAVPEPVLSDARPGRWRSFGTGFTTNLLNPKVGVFYLSVLPQFVPAYVNVLAWSLLLGAIHVGFGILWLSMISSAVEAARRVFQRPGFRRRLEQVMGVTLIGFGARVAVDGP